MPSPSHVMGLTSSISNRRGVGDEIRFDIALSLERFGVEFVVGILHVLTLSDVWKILVLRFYRRRQQLDDFLPPVIDKQGTGDQPASRELQLTCRSESPTGC